MSHRADLGFETIKTPRVVAELRRAFDVLALLGIDWKKTRFATYLALLASAPEVWRTPTMGSALEKADERLYWEAVGQAMQLTTAARAWPYLDRELLGQKLRLVVKGPSLPPSSGEDDHSRNVLLELTTAALLWGRGLGIEITADREDMRVSLPGYDTFALECKRPAHADSLNRNLGRVRRQLMGRLSDEVRVGIVAIGVERIEGATENFLEANDPEHLRRILDRISLRLIDEVRRFGGPNRAFWPAIPVGAVVFCGAVLLREPPVLVGVSQISMFCTTAKAGESAAIGSAFGAVMSTVTLPT